ncbi:MAG: 16S rRNA (uracil(1498)-N(3))-methyltransferase [Sphingobacteriales bacterium]|nr:MAG: 16S rRNA (uracil(1498)-N(3))-methyltransferase [Sphingobacteriales bacterium]
MLPYFYQQQLAAKAGAFQLDEEASHHCTQVLRMKEGAALLLTDGKGLSAQAIITSASRKRTQVDVETVESTAAPVAQFGLAIAFTKNKSRNEWLLEKATEMGISHIFPVFTKRGEKDKLNPERLHNILVSAMLQSQQVYLPQLHEAQSVASLLAATDVCFSQKFIAHCESEQERNPYWNALETGKNTLVLVGPEGDFTGEEIEMSLKAGFKAVSFGNNRLRTETAGLYACTVFNAKNYG